MPVNLILQSNSVSAEKLLVNYRTLKSQKEMLDVLRFAGNDAAKDNISKELAFIDAAVVLLQTYYKNGDRMYQVLHNTYLCDREPSALAEVLSNIKKHSGKTMPRSTYFDLRDQALYRLDKLIGADVQVLEAPEECQHIAEDLLRAYRDLLLRKFLYESNPAQNIPATADCFEKLSAADTAAAALRTQHKNGERMYWALHCTYLCHHEPANVNEILSNIKQLSGLEMPCRTYFELREKAIEQLNIDGYIESNSIAKIATCA